MAWTAPTDRATGYLVTAVDWNIIEDNLVYLHGDSGALIDVSAGLQFLQAAGLILGASGTTDLRLNRQAAGYLKIADATGAGAGNVLEGGISGSVGAGTVTPNAANAVTRWTVTATGTVTIAAPTNPPSGNQSAQIAIIINNASGGAITLSWNAAFIGTIPGGPANGQGLMVPFTWNPGTSKWVGLTSITTAGM